jgi:hypothetical protein
LRQNDGCSETAIKAFLYNFEKLTSGANLMIPESALSAVESLPSYDALTDEKPELLKDTVSRTRRRTATPPHRRTATKPPGRSTARPQHRTAAPPSRLQPQRH